MDKYIYSAERRAALEGLRQAFAVYQFVDKRVVTLLLSDGFLDMFGYTDREQAVYDMDNDMYGTAHPDDVTRIANAAFRFATEGGRYEVIYRTRTKTSAEYRVIHSCGEHVTTETGVRLAHIWYTDRGPYTEGDSLAGAAANHALINALHEESILKETRYDFLTGLPSLNYFFELADAGKTALARAGETAVLLYIDLNGMKYFNHKYGFRDGDRLLKDFSRLLVDAFSNENCCHIGADRFAVYTKEAGLEDRLRQLFADAARINEGRSLPVRVGIYSSAIEDVPVSTAYDRAKLTCDTVRKSDVSGFVWYNRDLRAESKRRQYITTSIDQAVSEGWIQVYYQPIIRAVNTQICDEEALARWIDPTHGFLSPAEFIPILEDAGLIYKLDLCVLEQVLEKILFQEKNGIRVVPHSINLSRSDFNACDIVEEIRRRVDEAGVPRDKISVEITESMIGSDFDFMKEQIARFQALGFPVWMDDFGSGYSSLDVLQSIRFDLIKFDMSFMRKLDEGDSGKIILTELMKMATSLGLDTVCEGVETAEQARFLQEIGCSRLQGFYYSKPNPMKQLLNWYQTGGRFQYENPEESGYYDSIGRVNLFDLDIIARGEEQAFHNLFNTLPMGIIEIRGRSARFVRSNESYRAFIRRFFHLELSDMSQDFVEFDASFMSNVLHTCCEQGIRTFYDEKMPDGSMVHSFARRIDTNPVNGDISVAVVVLSVTSADEGASYAEIARALAADYFNLYYVDLDTDEYIEYSSRNGGEVLAMVRHGSDFFNSARRDTMTRVCAEDRAFFLNEFTKDNILGKLDEQHAFMVTYRLMDTGEPFYASMKIMRMDPDRKHLIIGVSNVDTQMRQKAKMDRISRERDTLARVMALSEDYLTLYMVNPETDSYVEFSATSEYRSLGLAQEGKDFFRVAAENVRLVLHPDDLPGFLQSFSREKVLQAVRETGSFRINYRLMLGGESRPVTMKITPFREGDGERLLVGIRAWKLRK
ncbi:MAG: EAL domain-containing protein [Clostridiales bacterium]|nr:EAL domain-containing protein [Clostridiales bacterium]